MATILVINDHVRELFNFNKKQLVDLQEAKKCGDTFEVGQLTHQIKQRTKNMRHIAITMGQVKQLGGCDIG